MEHISGIFAGPSAPGQAGQAATPGTQRTTGKLLAMQGYVIGIEINGSGSQQAVALADLNGHILYRARRPLEYVPDTRTVLDLVGKLLADATSPERLSDGRVLRVGVAVSGLVDSAQGVVRRLPQAHGWDNFPLQDYFADRLDVPCIIDNSANAAGLAEVHRGAGIGERVVLYVSLGRNIGGSLLVNSRIYHGTTGTAGEIGHMQVKEDGPRCSCGGSGHLEAIASAQAIVRSMIGLSIEYSETEAAISRLTGGRAERITVDEVFQLASEGDKIALYVVEEVQKYLGIALANVVHIVNPGMIILGGPVALVGERLIAPLQMRIQQISLPVASQSLRITQGNLGVEANLVGAITLALQDL